MQKSVLISTQITQFYRFKLSTADKTVPESHILKKLEAIRQIPEPGPVKCIWLFSLFTEASSQLQSLKKCVEGAET